MCARTASIDVLANWEKYTARQDGDAIRRLIGTIGVSSPLSSVRKAFISIRDAEEEAVRVEFFCFFFKSSGGWVKIKLKLPHFHVSDTCRVSI